MAIASAVNRLGRSQNPIQESLDVCTPHLCRQNQKCSANAAWHCHCEHPTTGIIKISATATVCSLGPRAHCTVLLVALHAARTAAMLIACLQAAVMRIACSCMPTRHVARLICIAKQLVIESLPVQSRQVKNMETMCRMWQQEHVCYTHTAQCGTKCIALNAAHTAARRYEACVQLICIATVSPRCCQWIIAE